MMDSNKSCLIAGNIFDDFFVRLMGIIIKTHFHETPGKNHQIIKGIFINSQRWLIRINNSLDDTFLVLDFISFFHDVAKFLLLS